MSWFGIHGAHLDDLQRELRLVLAKDAFRRDEPSLLAPAVHSAA